MTTTAFTESVRAALPSRCSDDLPPPPRRASFPKKHSRRRTWWDGQQLSFVSLLLFAAASLSLLSETSYDVGVVSAWAPPAHATHNPLSHQQQRRLQSTRLFQASTVIPPPPASHLKLPFLSSPAAAEDETSRTMERSDNKQKQRQLSSYQRRKDEWVRKYTSVDALREAFGSNRNRLWGDLDPSTTRRLYKSLLPKALLELYELGVHPEDLAPLAYRARVAAKLYARERSALPARVAANLYDGFRQWRKYGSFDTSGMSYQQLWEKYATMILDEMEAEEDGGAFDKRDDLTAKICLKILERSCETNEMVDSMVLKHANNRAKPELDQFRETLEDDVRRLLQTAEKEFGSAGGGGGAGMQPLTAERVRLLRRIAKFKRHLGKLKKDAEDYDRKSLALKQHAKQQEEELGLSHSHAPINEHRFPWQDRSRKSEPHRHKWSGRHPKQ